jgi:hypothetical protein
MKQNAREFIRSTTMLLDHVLAALTPEQQPDLLDALDGRRRCLRLERGTGRSNLFCFPHGLQRANSSKLDYKIIS